MQGKELQGRQTISLPVRRRADPDHRMFDRII